MMSEERLAEINSEQKDVTKKQEALYERQRSVDRLNEGIGTYFQRTQRLLQKTRETFRKNDGSRDFDEIYSFFSRDAGKAMGALGKRNEKSNGPSNY